MVYFLRFTLIVLLIFNISDAFATSFGVWSEWTSFSKLEQQLSTLSNKNIRLHLALKKDELTSNQNLKELIELLRKAEKQNVEIWAWPLLERNQGYWLNQWNAEKYSAYVKNLIQKLELNQVKISGLSMDLEPPPEILSEILDSISKLKINNLKKISNKYRNDELFEKGSTIIKELSSWVHQHGIKTHLVTTPLLLENQSATLQRSLGIPMVETSMDYISFMSYRSEYERFVGKMNSRMIYEHAITAKTKYGNQASIDLGVVGNIEFPHELKGYKNPELLWEDISAAKAGGVDRIQVYCLDGMDHRDWIKDVPENKPRFSFKNLIIHRFFDFILKKI